METMKDYHDLYLKCELLFLTDVLEKFRNSCLKNHGLCLTRYLSAIWKKVVLEIISDPDMNISFEKGKRCDIFYISNRYNKVIL